MGTEEREGKMRGGTGNWTPPLFKPKLRLCDYLTASRLLPDLQSACRARHSTKTALLKVLGDILQAFDSGNIAVLTLLDLSAAVDTVDHATLQRLDAS